MKKYIVFFAVLFALGIYIPAYASNIILGPPGIGSEHLVSINDLLNYEIQFENDPSSATAPVQVLTITQTLDYNLDFETFRLGDFGFGGNIYGILGDLAYYSTRIDFTDYSVDFEAGIDVSTGEATWRFTTIDRDTGEVPFDSQVGFLPVNNNSPEGEGFVRYSVLPKSTAVDGDVIDAKASIVFDTNAPIDTPPIFNTISVTTVPEPTVIVLLGFGIIGIAGFRRKA